MKKKAVSKDKPKKFRTAMGVRPKKKSKK